MANNNTFGSLFNVPTFVNPVSESAFPAVSGGALRAFVNVRPDLALGLLDGHPFQVRAVARVTGGTTTNFTLAVYANMGGNTNLTTFTNDIKIMTTGAVAINSTSRTVILEGQGVWDSVAQRFDGNFDIQFGATYTAPATLTTSVTTGLSVIGNLGFFATALFSASNAANLATLTELSLSAV